MEPVSCAGCQAVQRRLRDLQAENDRLRRQLDEATRAGKRQAAQAAEEQYRSLSGAEKEHFAMLCRLTHRP
jgi:hypothetical protein